MQSGWKNSGEKIWWIRQILMACLSSGYKITACWSSTLYIYSVLFNYTVYYNSTAIACSRLFKVKAPHRHLGGRFPGAPLDSADSGPRQPEQMRLSICFLEEIWRLDRLSHQSDLYFGYLYISRLHGCLISFCFHLELFSSRSVARIYRRHAPQILYLVVSSVPNICSHATTATSVAEDIQLPWHRFQPWLTFLIFLTWNKRQTACCSQRFAVDLTAQGRSSGLGSVYRIQLNLIL